MIDKSTHGSHCVYPVNVVAPASVIRELKYRTRTHRQRDGNDRHDIVVTFFVKQICGSALKTVYIEGEAQVQLRTK